MTGAVPIRALMSIKTSVCELGSLVQYEPGAMWSFMQSAEAERARALQFQVHLKLSLIPRPLSSQKHDYMNEQPFQITYREVKASVP